MTQRLTTHLRRALEEAETEARPIKLTGPLGQAFTEMLQHEYAKKDPEATEEGQIATESQQLEEQTLKRVASMLTGGEVSSNQSVLQVFGVSQTEATEEDVIQMTQDVAALPSEHRDEFVLIIKEEPDTQQTEVNVEAVSAMESFAKVFGIQVYPSLEAFAKAHFG